ncbi:MAG: hypothetical protein JO180_12115, partial [Gemmatirosa sp.]|nr:hypothetical protein [Gemmatirosa sp.]
MPASSLLPARHPAWALAPLCALAVAACARSSDTASADSDLARDLTLAAAAGQRAPTAVQTTFADTAVTRATPATRAPAPRPSPTPAPAAPRATPVVRQVAATPASAPATAAPTTTTAEWHPPAAAVAAA